MSAINKCFILFYSLVRIQHFFSIGNFVLQCAPPLLDLLLHQKVDSEKLVWVSSTEEPVAEVPHREDTAGHQVAEHQRGRS